MPGRSSSPPFKRIKLEVADDYISLDSDKYIEVKKEEEVVQEEEEEEDGEQCSICLQNILDRTIVPTCSHEFCFECVLIWTGEVRVHKLYALKLYPKSTKTLIMVEIRTITAMSIMYPTHRGIPHP